MMNSDEWWMMTPASKNLIPFDFWMNPQATGSHIPRLKTLVTQPEMPTHFHGWKTWGNGTQNVFIAKIQLVFQESNYAKYEIQIGSWGTKGIKIYFNH